MFENYPDVLTVKELRQMLKIGKNTAYEIIRAREIESVTIGRQIRIPKENVTAFIRKSASNHIR